MNFAIGRSGFVLATVANIRDQRIEVQFFIKQGDIEAFYHLLLEQKDEIEAEIGSPLIWKQLPHRKRSQVTLSLANIDPSNKNDWATQHEWLQRNLESFYRSFSPRIKALDPADWMPDDEDGRPEDVE